MTASMLVALALSAADGGVSLEARLEALEQRLSETKSELELAKEDVETLKEQLETNAAAIEGVSVREESIRESRVSLTGYLDVGFFAVQGNGSGVRKDLDRTLAGGNDLLSTWVLRGDPLATAINSRGEPADLGDSRAITFDGLRTGGRPTFLVNAVNLQLHASVGDEVQLHAMVDLLPRERTVTQFALGDFLDVKLAWARWARKFGFGELTVWAGKVDPVLGVEYRFQEAPDRLTVTPSLLCRYTCGRALGLRGKLLLLDESLEVLVGVTNGSNQLELQPWGAESGFNLSPMLSGRVGVLLPFKKGVELSVNGAVGVQDRQSDPTVWQFHAGASARVDLSTIFFTAEGGFGRAAGKTGLINEVPVACAVASCLLYRSAYLLAGWRAALWLVPYARIDWRSGTMQAGREWFYESQRVRVTAGLKVEPVRRLTIKAEYTVNRELVGPDFPDDVFTTSLIVSY